MAATDVTVVAPTSVSDQSANGYIAYTGNFTGFSQFMLGKLATPLPIKSVELKATAGNKQIFLSWDVNARHDAKSFFVERSIDAKSFQTVGRVNAAAPVISYEFIDADVDANTTYFYRIRAIGINGQEVNSAVKSARLGDQSEMSIAVSPNPADKTIWLSARKAVVKNAELVITGVEGKIYHHIYNADLTNPMSIDIKALPAGVYMMSLKADKLSQVLKFVKL